MAVKLHNFHSVQKQENTAWKKQKFTLLSLKKCFVKSIYKLWNKRWLHGNFTDISEYETEFFSSTVVDKSSSPNLRDIFLYAFSAY